MFRKLMSVLLIIALLVCNTGTIAFAEGWVDTIAEGKIGSLEWELSYAGKLKFTGAGDIPNYTSDKPAPWAEYSEEIINITMHTAEIYSIGDYAFYNCKNLDTVNFSDYMKSIGKHSFDGCSSIDNLDLPSNINAIGVAAFSNCTSLIDFIIPSKLIKIEDYTFSNIGTKDIVIPGNVTEIGKAAFSDCAYLEKVTLPSTISIIEDIAQIEGDAFAGTDVILYIPFNSNHLIQYAESYGYLYKIMKEDVVGEGKCGDDLNWTLYEDRTLKISGVGNMYDYSGYFPDSEAAPWKSFNAYNRIKMLVLEEGISHIGDNAFGGCNSLSGGLVIPDSVISIGKSAFVGCYYLTGELVIPEGVITLGDSAFYGCSGFTGDLIIPGSVEIIGTDAFGLTELTLRIPYSATNKEYLINYAEQESLEYLVNPPEVMETGECGKNLTWTLYEGGTLEISGTGDMYDYEYVYNDASTTAPWYEHKDKIKNLVLGKGITSIGDWAFYKCDSITGELIIPKGVTRIGDTAFRECSGFTGNLVIPEGVTYIGSSAFYECIGFTGDLIIPDTVTTIGSGAFASGIGSGFDGKLVLSKNITTIEEATFIGLVNIIGDLIIPEGVRTIGPHAFEMCGFDGNLVIPDGVKTIDQSAFASCGGFTGETTIPESVTKIGAYAFTSFGHYYKGIIINLLCTEATIDPYALSNRDICFYKIPEDADYLIQYAIDNELSYELVESNIIDAGKCGDNLTWKLYKDGTLRIFGTGDMYDYGSGDAPWKKYYNNKLKRLVLEEGITSIGGNAFYDCNCLTGELVIPKSVTKIGYDAFQYCTGFTGDLIIPEGVIELGEYAFDGCSGFTGNLVLSESLAEIESGAFYGCNGFTGNLVIPESVRHIAQLAFYRCSGFTGDLIIPEGVIELGEYAFDGCSGFDGRLVISESVTQIKRETFARCSGFTGDLVIPKYVTEIEAYAFDGCSGFNGNLILPEGIRSIGEWAFSGCSGFTGNLIIPGSIGVIEQYAFAGCTGLSGDLVIKEGITEIREYAFQNCSGLTGNLVLPKSLKVIKRSAFRYCSGFTGDLIIPKTVTTIEGEAFSGCSGFTGDLIIPETMTEIEGWTFRYCNGFDGNLIIPEGIQTIGAYAFDSCTGFTGNLTIPESVKEIEAGAFSATNFTMQIEYEADNMEYLVQYAKDNDCKYNIAGISAEGYEGMVDGNYHSIKVIAPSDTNIVYSKQQGGEYSITKPEFKNPGTYEVYYKVIKDGNELITGFATVVIEDSNVLDMGICGADLRWYVYKDGTLKICGSGEMYDYSPWSQHEDTITSLDLEEGITKIGERAFSNCSGLNGNLVIPNSVMEIGEFAFADCSGFTGELVIPEGVTKIGYGAFRNCSGFTGDLVIPEGVEEIGGWAFYNCSGLTGNLIVPESVTTIGATAFNETHVTLKVAFTAENVVYLVDYAKNECLTYRITDISVEGYEGVYDGKLHNITVTVPEGAIVEYATSEYGQYSEVKPMFVNVCEETVYYKIKKGSDVLFEGYETVEITPAGLVGVVATSNEAIYDGNAHGITVTAPEGAVVTYSTSLYGSYSEEMPALTDVGTRTIFYKVQKDNYIEVVGSETITITPRTIEDLEVELEYDSIVYDGNYKYPMVTVEGLADYDYEVIYDNNISAGTATVTITGVRNCTGTITKTFVIDKATMSVTSYGYTGIYDGNGHSIDVYAPSGARVTYSTSENGNFTSTKPSLANVGTKTIYYKVERDNYVTVTGSEVVTITPADLVKVTIEGYKGIYDGNEHGLTVSALSNAKVTYSTSLDGEYTEEAPTLTNVGTMTVYYKIEKDNYVAAIGSETIVIEPRTIADMEATLEYESVVYDAVAKTPAVTVVGLSESDYEVSYENNTNVGRATVTITGVGNYNGKITKVFDITPAGIAGITASDYEGAFDGKAHSITVNAPEGAVVKYSTSLNGVYSTQAPTLTNVGTMTVFYRVERANFVTVVDAATVTITAKSIEDMNAELEYDSVMYDGTAKLPAVTVEGLASSDYEVSYEDNTNAGTATVTITGKGNFEDTITKTFEITKATLDGVLAEGYEGIYDGTAYSITVTAPEDMVVTYATSEDGEYTTEKPMLTEAGKYTVYYKVVRDNYETYISFETVIIMPKTIEGLELEIEYDEVIFNDTAKTPSVKVDGLSENDFEVAYTNNIEIGTATVTITGTGNYTGTITKTFEILDPGVTGDVNGDGIVNTVDASIVISYYYGNVEFDETQMRLADVNGDGVISTVDASMIISYYYGNIDSFA